MPSGVAVDFMTSFMAGGVAGGLAKTITAPIERVKLLLQTQDSHPLVRKGEVVRYNGIVNCFSRVVREQGPRAFWRGNLANMQAIVPAQMFTFAFKDSIKLMFSTPNKHTEFWTFFAINVASGGLAGAGSLLCIYPFDFARTRLAADVGHERQFKSSWHCLGHTIKAQGPLAVYKGLGVSLLGIVPYRGVYFGLFDTLSGYNPYQRDRNFSRRTGSKVLCAQVSAIAAGYVSYPFDTVRRRLQMQADRPPSECVYGNTREAFRKIVSEEGGGALFKGASVNAVRTVGSALVLVLYSEILHALTLRNKAV